MKLGHRIDGDGERVVVLMGSLGSTLDMWGPQLALTREFRVLRVDQPGHGESDLPESGATVETFANSVLDLLESLGIRRFSFCGLSLGGCIGMSLALNASDRIDRLVLCCTSPRIGTPQTWAERIATVRNDGMEAIADSVVGRWFTQSFASSHQDVVRGYRDMIAATPPEGYARCCEALAQFDLRDQAAAIETPTLVIAGDEDPVVSVQDARELASSVRDSRLAVLSPAAHLANVERSDEFNRELLTQLSAEVTA